MTTKGPQNLARKDFQSSMDVMVEFGETLGGPRPAADLKHKPGRYNLLKIMAEFANSANMFASAVIFHLNRKNNIVVIACCSIT